MTDVFQGQQAAGQGWALGAARRQERGRKGLNQDRVRFPEAPCGDMEGGVTWSGRKPVGPSITHLGEGWRRLSCCRLVVGGI